MPVERRFPLWRVAVIQKALFGGLQVALKEVLDVNRLSRMGGLDGGKEQRGALDVVVQLVRRRVAAVEPVDEQLGQPGVGPGGWSPSAFR